ncbi:MULTISPECIES: substrate-binding periplasmic protein [unclassified Brevibacterium]|uniref:substrate-binding periplasmic protein n=1 Tax=unclassified Brevibacterium TaxID=2614124 RepID=UPI00143D501E|nr:transporter substrate-binding domain-containing protein [Brevibacterium sp. S22]
MASIQQLPGSNVNAANGEYSGVDSILMPRFAEENCLKLDVKPLDGAAATASLTEERADIGGGGWTKTEDRAKILGLTKETLWYSQTGILAHQKMAPSVESLRGQKVGIIGGSLYEEPLSKFLGEGSVTTYSSMDSILNDLEIGRLDVTLASEETMKTTVEKRNDSEELQFVPFDYDPDHEAVTAVREIGYVYTDGNDSLGAALDDFIIRSKDEGLISNELETYGLNSKTTLEGPDQ